MKLIAVPKLYCVPLVVLVLMRNVPGVAQEQHTVLGEELRLEGEAAVSDGEVEDDSYLLEMEELRRHPVALNAAGEDELRKLSMLTALQVSGFVAYRSLLGKIISLYELQAVPGWDLQTIRSVLPYITLNEHEGLVRSIAGRLRGGQFNLLLRTSVVPQVAAGYQAKDTTPAAYRGSSSRLFFRLQYNYKNVLQYGIVGDKDAGEQFFSGKQKHGFDFYSYHLFIRKGGIMKTLALGDYSVSMGQGLVQWQSSGMRKNADAMLVKRQGEVLKPYRSAGEFNFMRGAAATFAVKRVAMTLFASYRKLSASHDADSAGVYVSSIATSGYHRTELELAKRQNLAVSSAGGVARYRFKNGMVSVNSAHYQFATRLEPQPKPYDLFGIRGKYWSNHSLDYSYSFRNVHSYGEIAADHRGNLALIQGFLLSVDRKLDLSVVYRSLSREYQSVAGATFTEGSSASNESGLYAGMTLRPRHGWTVNLYSDFFRSPWLKFTADAPSAGQGYLLQLLHIPRKGIEIYTRYSGEKKLTNVSGSTLSLPEMLTVTKREWRLQVSNQFNKQLLFRTRISVSWYGEANHDERLSQGFLAYTDVVWKPSAGPLSGSFRIQHYDTDNYNTRIYAYENSALYDMSIPAFYDKGWRYYVNVRYKPGRFFHLPGEVTLWIRYGETLSTGKGDFGSGLDKINRSSKSEWRFQLVFSF